MISLVTLCRLTILLSKEMFDEAFKLAEQYNLDRQVQCMVLVQDMYSLTGCINEEM